MFCVDVYTCVCVPVCAQVSDSEMKASALKLELDRLHLALARAEESEGTLKERLQSLAQCVAESNTSQAAAQDRLLTLQKSLSASEQERRLLQVTSGTTPTFTLIV